MERISLVRSRAIFIPQPNIDTDQIIPARFLTTTTREGLGRHLFSDWRYTPDGTLRPDAPFNRPDQRGHRILVAGPNFGCGSSREHAVWALQDWGIAAVVSTQFADIFRGNAGRNGLIPAVVAPDTHAWILDHAEVDLTIDLERAQILADDMGTCPFEIDPFVRRCLLEGVDELGYLLNRLPEIEAQERRRACTR